MTRAHSSFYSQSQISARSQDVCSRRGLRALGDFPCGLCRLPTASPLFFLLFSPTIEITCQCKGARHFRLPFSFFCPIPLPRLPRDFYFDLPFPRIKLIATYNLSVLPRISSIDRRTKEDAILPSLGHTCHSFLLGIPLISFPFFSPFFSFPRTLSFQNIPSLTPTSCTTSWHVGFCPCSWIYDPIPSRFPTLRLLFCRKICRWSRTNPSLDLQRLFC